MSDKMVDLANEKEQLRKAQILQDKPKKACEFMKQFVINGRSMMDAPKRRLVKLDTVKIIEI